MAEFDFIGELFGLARLTPEQLDEEWKKACTTGNFDKYEMLKNNAKISGCKVYRNSQGKHKVVPNG